MQRRDSILAAVRHHRVTIWVAPTGSGKSTMVPHMLLDEAECSVLCTQPRRIAAMSLASRMASLRTTELGDMVGYRIGGCTMVSRNTRLVYAVTAIALSQCLEDDGLSFDYLIIDEFHFRDVFMDMLLAVVVTRVLPRHPGVKVILMSAAFDTDRIRKYVQDSTSEEPGVLDLQDQRIHKLTETFLDDLPAVSTEVAKTFQDFDECDRTTQWSDVFSCERPPEFEDLSKRLAAFLLTLHKERPKAAGAPGAFLVFLPGIRDLVLLAEQIKDNKEFAVRQVHSGQTVEVQEQVLRSENSDKRLVIVGTDVLESSVTIPDVDFVVDTCVHKRPRWDPAACQSLLTSTHISKDEALQRAGRTGRVRPGEVIRLVTRSHFDSLVPHVEPQIRHSRLEEVILTLFDRQIGEPREFLQSLPEPPNSTQVDQALIRLLELGALKRHVDGHLRLTHFGRFLQRMPLDPEVGSLVMNGVRYGVVRECAIIAAVTQRGEPFLVTPDWTLQQALEYWAVRDTCARDLSEIGSQVRPAYPSDLITAMRAYQAWQQMCEEQEE